MSFSVLQSRDHIQKGREADQVKASEAQTKRSSAGTQFAYRKKAHASYTGLPSLVPLALGTGMPRRVSGSALAR